MERAREILSVKEKKIFLKTCNKGMCVCVCVYVCVYVCVCRSVFAIRLMTLGWVCSAKPQLRPYVLMTTFPNRDLTDDTVTIADAGLLNAVVVQRAL